MTEVLARLAGVERRFGSVVALDGASLTVRAGEIHALLGGNGAGKSTLLNVLGGMIAPDAGTVEVGGAPVVIETPRDARRHGIALVHQHFALVPPLTAVENLALGRGRPGDVREAAEAVMEQTGLRVKLDAVVEELSVGDRQRLEILRALLVEPKVLVLDEPTAVLAPPEVDGLFALLRDLARAGTGIVLVGHKLDEVLSVADYVTVLRDGRTVLSEPAGSVDQGQLVEAMVGADRIEGVRAQLGLRDGRSGRAVAPRASGESAPVATLRDVTILRGGVPILDSITIEVHPGEILGVAGVEGNGQRELALLLAGRVSPELGVAHIPSEVGFIPQDRSVEGLIPDFDLVENVGLALQRSPIWSRGRRIDWPRVRHTTRRMVDAYQITMSSVTAEVRDLSGGNQQRLVAAREIEMADTLLVAENPTRGLDVASAAFVHRRFERLADEGAAVVLISTDLDEVLALSTRLVVLSRGRILPVTGAAPDRYELGRLMLGADRSSDAHV